MECLLPIRLAALTLPRKTITIIADDLLMTWEAYLTFTVIAAALGCLAFTRIAADVILMCGLVALVVTQVLTPQEALKGFSNTGVMTIAVLYIIAAGLKETGAVHWIAHSVLGRPSNMQRAQIRMAVPVSALGAFLNNTTVVAMFIPAIQEWCRRLKMSPSKLLLPLSYIVMLSGTCTLIGTSTNLVIDGLLQQRYDIALGMFDIAWVGVPLLLIGGSFLVFVGYRMLPDRQGVLQQVRDAREYAVEVKVDDGGPIVGKSIVEAGLRNLAHGYLAEIERRGRIIPAVSPDTQLEAGDILYFVGAPDSARELRAIRGLTPASGSPDKLDVNHHERCLVEVVLGPDFPSLGQTIREARFRSNFQAVILSVSREGNRLPGKLGDIKLNVGDTLLLETSESFVDQYRFRKDFLLVSPLSDSTPPNYAKAPTALIILAAMVVTSAFGLLSILEAAMIAAGAMLATRCVTAGKARRYVDLTVLVVIASSFALGEAMNTSGAAAFIANGMIGLMAPTPWLALLMVYLLTSLFTEIITNNAAAVLMFPIAAGVADGLGVSIMPFVVAVMFAASASFMTPLSYQTNLMVYGPGGYRFSDYIRLGLPMNIIACATAVLLIPLVWSF